MHSIKYNKIQQNTNHTIQFIISINSYIFQHWSAILWEFIKTKDHKSNTIYLTCPIWTRSLQITYFKVNVYICAPDKIEMAVSLYLKRLTTI